MFSELQIVKDFFEVAAITAPRAIPVSLNAFATEMGYNTGRRNLAESILSYVNKDIDKNSADYGVRTYVWGSVSAILSNASFVFDGKYSRIENMDYRPFNTDFDFYSSNFFTDMGGALVLRPKLDSYQLGEGDKHRAVLMEFTNKSPAASGLSTYSYDDYKKAIENDVSSNLRNGNIASATYEIFKIIDNLKTNNVIDYEISGNKYTAYGTNKNDKIAPKHEGWSGTIVAGGGNDTIFAGSGNDLILGGAGNDKLIYGEEFYTYDYSIEAGKAKLDINIPISAGRPITIILGPPANIAGPGVSSADRSSAFLVNDGLGGTDTIVSVEKVVGTSANDTVVIKSLVDSVISNLKIDLGAGSDGIDLSQATDGYVVDLRNQANQTVIQRNPGPSQSANAIFGPLILRNIENVAGSKGNDKIYAAPGGGQTIVGLDPLVLDLDGDGIEVTAFDESRAPLFDIDGDGVREATAWVNGGDGLLARDLNNDGKINSVAELFGKTSGDGFADLRALDDNADGVIDAADVAFSSLRVWVDSNGNAITDAGELKTLNALGITSISLTTRDPSASESIVNGNEITAIGWFTTSNGTKRDIANVALVYLDGTSNDDDRDSDGDGRDEDRDDPTSPGIGSSNSNRPFTSIVDGGEGNDEIYALDGERKLTSGGLGRDFIYNRSNGGVIYGDAPSGYYEKPVLDGNGNPVLNSDGSPKTTPTKVEDTAANSDNIWFSANTVVKDAQHHDFLKFYGLTLTGGNAEGGIAGLGGFGGLVGAATGLANFYASLDENGKYDPARSVYFDHLFPWMTYVFRPNGSGGLDMYITNQFDQLFTAVFDATPSDAYKKQQALDAQGILKGWMKVENFDLVGSFIGYQQASLAGQGTFGMVFKAPNPIADLMTLLEPLLGIYGIALAAQYGGNVLIDQAITLSAAATRFAKGLKWADGADPLVIDLDGDGIETTEIATSQVYFDVDGDLFAERTGWLKGDDGFLVRDLNGNGRIDDVSEMFGGVGRSGFAQLAELDSNGDGRITRADMLWAELKVWQDRDGDGVTDAGELRSLDQLGIVTLDLASTAIDIRTPQGARLTGFGDVTFESGAVRRMFDAILASNDTDTRFAGEAGRAIWQPADTLDLKGFGRITNLSVATANDIGFPTEAMTAPKLRCAIRLRPAFRSSRAHPTGSEGSGGAFGARLRA